MNFIDSIISGETERRTYPHYALKMITKPPCEPVTLQECKDLARITTSMFDNMLTRLLKAARIQIEKAIGYSIVQSTWEQTQDYIEGIKYPAYLYRYAGTGGKVELRKKPLLSVVKLEYINDWSDDTPILYTADNYIVHQARNELMIRMGAVVPTHRYYQSVITTFKAGFYSMLTIDPTDVGPAPGLVFADEVTKAQAEVPEDIKTAIIQYAAAMFADPEGTGAYARNVGVADIYGALPHGVKQLLDGYVEWRLA